MKFIINYDTDKIQHGRYIVCNFSLDTKTIIAECKKIAPEKVKEPLIYINLKVLHIQVTGNKNTDFLSYISYNPSYDNSKSKKYITYINMEDTFKDMLSLVNLFIYNLFLIFMIYI